MSYSTVSQCVNNANFQNRVTACCAKEGQKDPTYAMSQLLWKVACAQDIEDAFAYALNAGNPDPGGDETVITDQMILSVVQPLLPAVP